MFLTQRFIVTLLLIILHLNQQVRADLAERFRREYPASSEKLRVSASNIVLKGIIAKKVYRRKESVQEKKVSSTKFVYTNSADSKKVSLSKVASNGSVGTETIYCITRDDSFSLRRDSPSDPIQVRGLNADRDKIDIALNNNITKVVGGAYSVAGVDFKEIQSLSTYKELESEEVTENQELVYHMKFQTGDKTIDVFDVFFSPDNNWRIKKYELRPGSLPGAIMSSEIFYQQRESLLPSSVVFRDVDLSVVTSQITTVMPVNVTKNEFKLSFYGFSDSLNNSSKITWTSALARWGLVISLVICFAISAVFLLNRVNRSKPAPKT